VHPDVIGRVAGSNPVFPTKKDQSKDWSFFIGVCQMADFFSSTHRLPLSPQVKEWGRCGRLLRDKLPINHYAQLFSNEYVMLKVNNTSKLCNTHRPHSLAFGVSGRQCVERKNNTVVEYALHNVDKGMVAATFSTSKKMSDELKGV
jgi:hypothetical protein